MAISECFDSMSLFVCGRVQQGLHGGEGLRVRVRVRLAPSSAASGVRVRYGRITTTEQDVGCASQYVLGGVEGEQAFELRRQLQGAFSLVPIEGCGHAPGDEVSGPLSSGGRGLADRRSRGTAELEIKKDLPVLVGVGGGQGIDGQKVVQPSP
ncbi:hypothetical protein [Streptomyces rishiriensis]|uniref:hypothetical protein n=1 Tax=Streptomyces rishiriensis TaxID=68264 RepID=UPI00142E27AA|nr:hypothetical protein [Streptomyces rishiriensis]